MDIIKKSLLLAVVLASSLLMKTAFGDEGINRYPHPVEAEPSGHFRVFVNNVENFVYQTSAKNRTREADTASFSLFAIGKGVKATIRVENLDLSAIKSAVIRPLDEEILISKIENNAVTFTIDRPCQISIEMDNALTHKLFLFVDEPLEQTFVETDEGVMYFGAGMHDIGESFHIPNDIHTVYFAPGSYVKGQIYTDLISRRIPLQIIGRGILSGENIPHEDLNGLIRFTNVRVPISIDGITLVDSFSFHIDIFGSWADPAKPHRLHNIKMVSWAYNTDGYHVNGFLEASKLFIFNSDDALDIGQFTLGAKINDCVIWNRRSGSALLVSWVSRQNTGNTIVKNIDVIHFEQNNADWENCAVIMALHGEAGNINNLYIDDLRVETFGGQVRRLIGLRLKKSPWSDIDSPYGSISNIFINNVRVDEDTADNAILGYSRDHRIENIYFDNLVVNGKPVYNLKQIGIAINSHAENISFTQSWVNNGHFEATESGIPGWTTIETAPVASIQKTNFLSKKAFSGWYFGVHSSKNPYTADTFQDISLPDGTYTLTTAVRSDGKQNACILYAHTGALRYETKIYKSNDYQIVTLDDIQVQNGLCKVGLYSEAPNGGELFFDGVVLQRRKIEINK